MGCPPPPFFSGSVAFRDRAECGVHPGGGGGGGVGPGGGVHRVPHAAHTGGAHFALTGAEIRGTGMECEERSGIWNLESGIWKEVIEPRSLFLKFVPTQRQG